MTHTALRSPGPQHLAWSLIVFGAIVGAGCKRGPEQLAPRIAEARELTGRFQEALKGELMAAMEAGGPANGIEVCKVEASLIASRVLDAEQKARDLTISRTALRVRNPANAPTDWQRRVLIDMRERVAAGADPASVEWHEVIDGRLRYMRAIALGPLCTVCHGDTQGIQAEVKRKLAELYPRDEATGFSVGELRGAFVVTAPVEK